MENRGLGLGLGEAGAGAGANFIGSMIEPIGALTLVSASGDKRSNYSAI